MSRAREALSLDRDVLALDVAGLAQPLPERVDNRGASVGGEGVQPPNDRHLLLLRAGCKRHDDRCSTESAIKLRRFTEDPQPTSSAGQGYHITRLRFVRSSLHSWPLLGAPTFLWVHNLVDGHIPLPINPLAAALNRRCVGCRDFRSA